MKLLGALFALVLSAVNAPVPLAAPGEPRIDFNVDAEQLGPALQMLSALGGFNVVVDPQVARARITMKLRQVSALEALRAVAQGQKLKVERDEQVGGRPTYYVARPDKLEHAPGYTFAPGVSKAGRANFSFRDVELTYIFQDLARVAGVNLALDPQVARAKMWLDLRDMTPLEALRVAARIQELAIAPLDVDSSVPTFLVGRPDRVAGIKPVPLPVVGHAGSYEFKDVVTGTICEVLAKQADVNVHVDPLIAHARAQLSLRGLRPLDALKVVCAMQELALVREPFVSARPTYLVTRPPPTGHTSERIGAKSRATLGPPAR